MQLRSWVEPANAPDTDFPIENLPYGSFRRPGEERVRLGVAIGDQVLDATGALGIGSMEEVMEMRPENRLRLRARIAGFLADYTSGAEKFLSPAATVEMLLPCRIGDYTDFYASIHHATNVGKLFRPDNPLMPNYKWVPIAYHGRSSSIVISGTPIPRPRGQIVESPAGPPVYAPTRMLDYELEVGAFLGPGNKMGQPVRIGEAEENLFGVCLLSDWSARDIQSWESQPLGPFLAKNFATSISPWVVTREALEPFRCAVAARGEGEPDPLPYLRTSDGAYRIMLEVWFRSAKMKQPVCISHSDFSSLYWTVGQMIAHHTSN